MIVRRIVDRARCTISILVFEAFPHSSQPYVQMGFSKVL